MRPLRLASSPHVLMSCPRMRGSPLLPCASCALSSLHGMLLAGQTPSRLATYPGRDVGVSNFGQ